GRGCRRGAVNQKEGCDESAQAHAGLGARTDHAARYGYLTVPAMVVESGRILPVVTIDALVHFCHTRAVQVWTKLTLGFAVTGTLIIGAYGAQQLRQEDLDLHDAAERDLRLLGAAVDVAVGNALREKQQADMRE